MAQSGKKLIFEKVPQDRSTSFEMENNSDSQVECAYHYHPEPELTLIVSGSGRMQVGTEWFPVGPGSLALIGSEVPHLFLFQPDPESRNETIVIKFLKIFTENGMLMLPEFGKIRMLFEKPHRSILWQDLHITDKMNLIFRLNGTPKFLELCYLLDSLPIDKGRFVGDSCFAIPPIRRKQQEQIEHAIDFLRKNYLRPITLENAAQAIRMNPESFRRFFQRSVRINFTDFVLEMRLTHAKRLLLETSDPISDIAERSGFPSLSNFNRLFLKHCGMQPRQYRKL